MEGKDLQYCRSLKLMQSFWNMQNSIMRYVQRKAAENDLSVTQYNILMMLVHHDEIPQKALQEKTFLPKSTLSQAINGLVDAGYLVRKQIKGNRREVKLSICQKGEDLMKKIVLDKDNFHQLCEDAIEALTDEQFTNLINTQQQIAANFEEQGSDSLC